MAANTVRGMKKFFLEILSNSDVWDKLIDAKNNGLVSIGAFAGNNGMTPDEAPYFQSESEDSDGRRGFISQAAVLRGIEASAELKSSWAAAWAITLKGCRPSYGGGTAEQPSPSIVGQQLKWTPANKMSELLQAFLAGSASTAKTKTDLQSWKNTLPNDLHWRVDQLIGSLGN